MKRFWETPVYFEKWLLICSRSCSCTNKWHFSPPKRVELSAYLGHAPLYLRSLRAFNVPGKLNQGADILSQGNVSPGEWRLHPQMIQTIWSVFEKEEVDLFALEDNFHCPTYFSKEQDALVHDWPNVHLYAFPQVALFPQVIRRVREVRCSPLADTIQDSPSLPSERLDLVSPARAVEPSCLVPRQESLQLSARVTNTILEARAPSTRCLYALKWSVFSVWFAAKNKDPSLCDMSSVLTFLQELLDKGCIPSTLKVYVAAIKVNHH